MEGKNLLELSEEEFQVAAKKIKSSKVYDSIFFGFLIGVAIYSTVKNGFGLLTFLPLVYIPISAKNKKKRDELDQIIKDRKKYKT